MKNMLLGLLLGLAISATAVLAQQAGAPSANPHWTPIQKGVYKPFTAWERIRLDARAFFNPAALEDAGVVWIYDPQTIPQGYFKNEEVVEKFLLRGAFTVVAAEPSGRVHVGQYDGYKQLVNMAESIHKNVGMKCTPLKFCDWLIVGSQPNMFGSAEGKKAIGYNLDEPVNVNFFEIGADTSAGITNTVLKEPRKKKDVEPFAWPKRPEEPTKQ